MVGNTPIEPVERCTWATEAYSDPCQTSKMELLVKIFNGIQLLTVFAKSSFLDVWQGSEYICRGEYICHRSEYICMQIM